jgi:hypothetical protein
MHVVGAACKAGRKRSWAPGCGLAIGALVDVYTYIHPYIDITMHGWPSGKRAWPKMKEVFLN